MHKLALIGDLATVWLSALFVGGLFASLRLPVIAGYILVGILIGPGGLKLISQIDQINVLAELGVALLLFALGVELNIRQIIHCGKRTLLAAFVQITLVSLAGALISYGTGIVHGWPPAFLIGFICALSSTAVVTKSLIDRAQTDSNHGRVLIPLLIMQDLALIPVMAALPTLNLPPEMILSALTWSLVKALLIVTVFVLGTRYWVSAILSRVAALNSKELFVLAVISICLSLSLLAGSLGLSLALGGFLAGLMISESPYGLKVLGDVVPLKDLFSTLFFVSVGLLLSPQFLLNNLSLVAGFCLVLIVVKVLAGMLAGAIATRGRGDAARVGVAMAQLGEFSFVLTTFGYQLGMLDAHFYQLFIVGAVITLILSPFLIDLTERLLFLDKDDRDRGASPVSGTKNGFALSNHLILKGFGRTGRNLALILKDCKIPFVVIELDGRKLKEMEALSIPFIYGDALNSHVLAAARVDRARCFVISGPDMPINCQLTKIARRVNKELRILVRAPRMDDVESLLEAGADMIIQPEFEASIEMTKLALVSMASPYDTILASLNSLRRNGYRLFKPDLELEPFIDYSHKDYYGLWYVYEDRSSTLDSLAIRKRTGITILALNREGEILPYPDGTTIVERGDQIYITGNEYQISNFESAYKVTQKREEPDRNERDRAEKL